MALFIGGYYTAFIKTLVKGFTKSLVEINPSLIKRILKNEEPHEREIDFDLVKAYRIHHILYIPIGWERIFFLHNYDLDTSCEIDENFHEALKKCKDDEGKYQIVINKYLKGKLESIEKGMTLKGILIGAGIFLLFVLAIILLAVFLG